MNKSYKNSLRIILVLILSVLIFYFFVTLIDTDLFIDTPSSKDYYIDNGYSDTGSKNLVTAIYLDYRLFDSVFEAGILLITVAGLVFMSVEDKKLL